MKKRKYLVIALLSAGCLFSPNILGNLKMSAEPPNIVFFMLDELGYFELSSMGNKKLKTPNIDRMALEGMRFTQALAGSPVCAPTRSTLMTGQHTGHTTVRRNAGDLALRQMGAGR